jgi:hypothetical protein
MNKTQKKPDKVRADFRPNGKAWKKKWGPGGPPMAVVDQAVAQSRAAKKKGDKR